MEQNKLIKKENKNRKIALNALLSKLDPLPKEEKIRVIDHLRKQLEETKYDLPIVIFDNKFLSALEAIIKYLKEELNLGFTKISKLLNRSDKTIWATYQKAKKKMPSKFVKKESKIFIAINVFSERKISVLENIVAYLKSCDLNYNDISILLNRSYRTIVTVHNRFKKKSLKIV